MYLEIVQDPSFYQFLLQIDQDLAEQVRQSGCQFCGAALHSACYMRKAAGLPERIHPDPMFAVCYSFCCSAEGCRRRHRAPSVRFLSRKVYLGVIVLLVAAMRQGPSPPTTKRLQELFGADPHTLRRWRHWWQEIFPHSDFWRRATGRFMPPVEESELPQSLIAAFTGPLRERVVALLKFLSALGSRLFKGPT